MSSRQTKSLIRIDSRNKTSTENVNNFNVDFNRAKYPGLKSIEMSNVNMDMTFYNVDSDNNKIHFEEDGTPRTASVAEGYYPYNSSDAPATLLVAIDSAMDTIAATDTYTSSYNADSKKISIAVDTGTYELILSNRSGALWDLLGYTSSTDSGAVASVTASDVLNLQNPSYIDVRSPEVSSMLDGNLESTAGDLKYSELLFRVRNDSNGWNQIIPKDSHIHKVIRSTTDQQISNIRLKTFKPDGNVAQHNAGNYWVDVTLTHEEKAQNLETKMPNIGQRANRIQGHNNIQ